MFLGFNEHKLKKPRHFLTDKHISKETKNIGLQTLSSSAL